MAFGSLTFECMAFELLAFTGFAFGGLAFGGGVGMAHGRAVRCGVMSGLGSSARVGEGHCSRGLLLGKDAAGLVGAATQCVAVVGY